MSSRLAWIRCVRKLMRRVRRRNGTAFAGARPTENPIWQSCVTSERGRFDRAGENRLTRCQLPTSPWSSCCQLTTICVLRSFGSTSPAHVRPVEPCPSALVDLDPMSSFGKDWSRLQPRTCEAPPEDWEVGIHRILTIRSLMTSARPCDPRYGKGDTRFNLGDPLA